MRLNRFFRPRSAKVAQTIIQSADRACQVAMEPLEDRQLLSLTVDIRTASGGKTAQVTSVGQVVQLQAWVVISGSTSGNNDGLESVCGSFLGTETSSTYSVAGNLGSPNLQPDYEANGAQFGTVQDLNGDGSKDIGSNTNSDIAGFFNARGSSLIQDGAVSGNTQSFEVGTFNYTVTSLKNGSATDVNFRLRSGLNAGAFDAVWVQDNVAMNDQDGTVLSGTPVVITDPNLSPPAATIAGSVTEIVSGITTPFSGVTMFLDSNTDGKLDNGERSVTTDSNGHYSISGLSAGVYYLRQVVPSGFTQTSPSSTPLVINLASSSDADTENFTDTASAVKLGSIAGTVSKVVSGATSGFAGVTVSLNQNSKLVTSTTTSSTGTYSFGSLPAGTYTISETVPTGYKQTSPSTSSISVTLAAGQAATGENFTDTSTTTTPVGSIAGTVDKVVSGVTSVDSGVTVYLDINNNGVLDTGDASTTTSSTGTYSFGNLPAGTYHLRQAIPTGYKQTSPTTIPTTIALTAGQNATGENFVDTSTTTTPAGSISGTVDKVVSGVTSVDAGVTVYLDINNDGSLNSGDASTVTTSSGTYTFGNLPAGTYHVRQVIPTGFKQTSPTTIPTTITLTAGQNATGENFVDTSTTTTPVGSISGTVSKVVSGVTSADSGVTVYLDTNNNGVLDTGEASTTTSSTGTYSFGNLPAGTYHLREVVPTGYTQTSPGSSPTNITLTAGQNATGENFIDTAAVVTNTGSITGTVYSDANSNSKFDSGELGIPGVTMYIDLKKDGKDDAGDPTTTTSSTGVYSFSGLAAGTYRVREVLPSGDKFTNPTAGYFDVAVGSAAKVTGENFGNTGPITLSGSVFNDANGNGTRDANEAGLSNWVIYVDLNNSGKFSSADNTKTSDSSGNFSFVSLKAGTYVIRIIQKTGYTLTDPTVGYYKVTLAPGNPISILFGEHLPSANTSSGVGSSVTLSGKVFSDSNSNGVQDSTEKGLSGWVVYADLSDSGKFVAGDNTKTTDANGNFEFVSLQPGTYTIRVIPQTGYTESSPSAGFYTVSLAPSAPVSIAFGEHA